MNLEIFFTGFDVLANPPKGVQKLQKFIFKY
ncbi:MAG: hypothetical protein N5P05_004353 (plasmid) [Chroococcopsis gigantea SAG 12.99]|jgi:hypothetical protein|nr:hypothetical protein [Chroococcopsis gigantea SAG 12.99]